MGEHDACPIPARYSLQGPRAACPLLGGRPGLRPEPPPEGFATWDDFRRDIGFPDSELGMGADSIIDPSGAGPRIWFRADEVAKVVKNRLHLDIHVSGGRTVVEGRSVPLTTRRQRVDAEAEAADGPRGHAHRSHERRRPRSLRGGHEGPGGERVRHQLTPSPAPGWLRQRAAYDRLVATTTRRARAGRVTSPPSRWPGSRPRRQGSAAWR